MPLARASELDRLLKCPGSLLIPRSEMRSESAMDAANWGTACHSWKETGKLPENPRYAKLLAEKIKRAGVDRLALWPKEGVHETSYALNVVTGVVRSLVWEPAQDTTHRDRWKAGFDDEWVTGTCDFSMDLFGGCLIDDLKTGRSVHRDDYEAQQSFYAYCEVISKYGELRKVLSTLTHWPRYPKDCKPVIIETVFSKQHLEDFFLSLKSLRAKVLQLRGTFTNDDLTSGDQCRFCPSRAACSKVQE